MRISTAPRPGWLVVALVVLFETPLIGFAQAPFTAPRSEPGALGARSNPNGIPTVRPSASWTEATEEKTSLDHSNAPIESWVGAEDCTDGWSFRLIPYGWAPGMHGDLTVRNRTAPIDLSIGDVLDIVFDDLEAGFMGQIEGNDGPCGFIFNAIYINISPGTMVRRLDFSSSFKMTILDLVGTYQLDCVPEMLCLPPGSRFELLAGARYFALDAGLTVSGPRGTSVTAQGTEEWVDPIIGGRLRMPLREGMTAQVRGDFGGFDIGDASKFTWNIEAIVEYRCSACCSLMAGWRWLDIDRESGSGNRKFGFDININGPIMGIVFDF